jgi:hypothetical protein
MTQVSSTPHAPRTFFVTTSGLADSTVSRKFQGVPYLQLQDQVRRYPLDHPVSLELLKDQVDLARPDRWLTHGQIAGTSGLTEAGARMLTEAHGLDVKVVNELGAPLFERDAALGAARLVVAEPARPAIAPPPPPKRLPASAKATSTSMDVELAPATKSATKATSHAATAVSHAASRLATQLGRAPKAAQGAVAAATVLGTLTAVDLAVASHLGALPTAFVEAGAIGAAAYGVNRIAAHHGGRSTFGKVGTYAALVGVAAVAASYMINRGGGQA